MIPWRGMSDLGRPLAFFDTEATGTNHKRHEVIEVGLVREAARGGDHAYDTALELCRQRNLPEPREISLNGRVITFETRVRPQRIQDAEPSALKINGYSDQDWIGAPSFETVAPVLSALLDDCIVIGSKPDFDIDIVQTEFDRLGMPHPRTMPRTIDIRTLAFEHLSPLGLRGTGLDSVCDFLGIDIHPRHRALPDALRSREAYRAIFRTGPLDRLILRLRRTLQEKIP
jgi:DNA polymerase III subunit epsilon